MAKPKIGEDCLEKCPKCFKHLVRVSRDNATCVKGCIGLVQTFQTLLNAKKLGVI